MEEIYLIDHREIKNYVNFIIKTEKSHKKSRTKKIKQRHPQPKKKHEKKKKRRPETSEKAQEKPTQ